MPSISNFSGSLPSLSKRDWLTILSAQYGVIGEATGGEKYKTSKTEYLFYEAKYTYVFAWTKLKCQLEIHFEDM